MIEGDFQPQFSEVHEEFKRNFDERDEVAASVCIMINGESVVDLWGGIISKKYGSWQKDTLSGVFSATKGATAFCAHMLASRGELDLHAPVTEYWPEFGQKGKEEITVAMLLNHQAGLPAVRDPLPDGAFYDWSTMVEALAAEEPFWKPGTRNGYHAYTFGWMVGEVVRRVSGLSVGEFFRTEIADPLGLDFWIGLPEEQEDRVAPLMPNVDEVDSDYMTLAAEAPESIPALLGGNTGGYMSPEEGGFNSREAHAAEIPAVGGITNARGLAGMYAPLASEGNLDGITLVDSDEIALMNQTVSATTRDASLKIPTRFSLGYMRSTDNRQRETGALDSLIMGSQAFGHVGMGGSLGFADPAEQMSFGYTMTRMGPGILLNERGQSLVDAAYRSLGYTSADAGEWK